MSFLVSTLVLVVVFLLVLQQQQQQGVVVVVAAAAGTMTSASSISASGAAGRYGNNNHHRHYGLMDDFHTVAEVSTTSRRRRRRRWTRNDSNHDSVRDDDENKNQGQDKKKQDKGGGKVSSWWNRRTMKQKEATKTDKQTEDGTKAPSSSKSKESDGPKQKESRRPRWMAVGRNKKRDSDPSPPPSKSENTTSAQMPSPPSQSSSSSSSSLPNKRQRKMMKFGGGLFHRKRQSQQPSSPSESDESDSTEDSPALKPDKEEEEEEEEKSNLESSSKAKSTPQNNQTSTSIADEEAGEGESKKTGSQIDRNSTKVDEDGDVEGEQQNNTTTSSTDEDKDKSDSPGTSSSTPTIIYGYRARPMGGSVAGNPTPIGISRASPYSSLPSRQHPHHQQEQQQSEAAEIMAGRMTAILVMTVASVIQNLTRLWVIQWIARKLAGESQLIEPKQHFIWECLNDKYTKDEEVWYNVLTKNLPPIGFRQRKWNKHVRTNMLQPQLRQVKKKQDDQKMKKTDRKQVGEDDDDHESNAKNVATTTTTSSVDPKTVVVIDLSTQSSNLDVNYLADVVTFLVGSHQQQQQQQLNGDDETTTHHINNKSNSNNMKSKQMFGPYPEVIIKIESGGGEVTSFALAAAQIARLRSSGWKVTACVDRIAASGGYMIASQADQVFGAPFAIVGSIGVISGGLNFHSILQKYGIKAIELKSGDQKNPISQFGPVSDKDMKIAQKKSDEIHRDFIDICLSRRPMLREDVCDGRVVNGRTARDVGLIDRVLTSDEYIYEKIVNGDVVMKLHRFDKPNDRISFIQALQILPHLRRKIGTFFNRLVSSDGNDPQASFRGSSVQPDLAGNIVTGLAFLSMVHSALKNKGLFGFRN